MSGQRMPEHCTQLICLMCSINKVLKGRAGWKGSAKRHNLIAPSYWLLSDNFCAAYLSPLTLIIATVW